MAGTPELLDDKMVFVAHLNRSTTIDGVITKHNRSQNPLGPFTVPRALDGFSRSTAEYTPNSIHMSQRTKSRFWTLLRYTDLQRSDVAC